MRNSLRFLLFIILCCTALILPLSAQNADVKLAKDIDPSSSQFDLIDLYNDRNRWENNLGIAMPRTAAVYQGNALFSIPVYTLNNGTAHVEFDKPCDLNGYHTLGIVCKIDISEEAMAITPVVLTIISGDQTLQATVSVPTNVWCEFSFDIGSWEPRNRIDRIEISYTPVPGEQTSLTFTHLRANAELDDAVRNRFMTDSFSIRGGEIKFSAEKDSVVIVPTESSPIIEANLLPPRHIGNNQRNPNDIQ